VCDCIVEEEEEEIYSDYYFYFITSYQKMSSNAPYEAMAAADKRMIESFALLKEKRAEQDRLKHLHCKAKKEMSDVIEMSEAIEMSGNAVFDKNSSMNPDLYVKISCAYCKSIAETRSAVVACREICEESFSVKKSA